MNAKIVQHDDDKSGVLRDTARAVTQEDFDTGIVSSVLKKMHSALDARSDGVALAAPQIGEPLRMFIVSGKIFNQEKMKIPVRDLIFINPELIELSKEKTHMEEGCLSVADLYGKVQRSEKAVIRAQNEDGEPVTLEGTGLLAQIFQHECDHLDGILFTDTATELHKPHHE